MEKPLQENADLYGIDPETGYDPKMFYTRSTDKRGHKDTVRVQLPPNLMYDAAVIVQRVPAYNTVQDFIRDSVVHYMHDLRDKIENPEFLEEVKQFEREATLAQRELDLQRQMATVEEVYEQLATAQRYASPEQFQETIRIAKSLAECLAEPHQSKLLMTIAQFEQWV